MTIDDLNPTDRASASYTPLGHAVMRRLPGESLYDAQSRAVADCHRLLRTIHARCHGWRADGSAPLPPEQQPRGNRLAAVAAMAELALAGEDVAP